MSRRVKYFIPERNEEVMYFVTEHEDGPEWKRVVLFGEAEINIFIPRARLVYSGVELGKSISAARGVRNGRVAEYTIDRDFGCVNIVSYPIVEGDYKNGASFCLTLTDPIHDVAVIALRTEPLTEDAKRVSEGVIEKAPDAPKEGAVFRLRLTIAETELTLHEIEFLEKLNRELST